MGRIYHGPYPLNKKNITEKVETNRRGVYKLYKSHEGPVKYVGRAEEKNLRKRLHYRKKEYRYFEFAYCSYKYETFESEATLYHRHKDDLENRKHPCQPYGNLECPICNKYG